MQSPVLAKVPTLFMFLTLTPVSPEGFRALASTLGHKEIHGIVGHFFFYSVCTELNATWNKLFRRWPHRDVTDVVLFILYLRIRCVTVYCTETRILLVMKIKTFLKTYFLVTWLPKVLLNSHGLICYILWSGINTINTVLTENGFNCCVI